jgi:dynein heavy chain, axonemal
MYGAWLLAAHSHTCPADAHTVTHTRHWFVALPPQGADNQKYDEVTDLPKLLSIIEEYLTDYNAQSKSRMDLVLFL